MSKGIFKERTQYLVREHETISAYLNDYVSFDPEAKPDVEAFTLSMTNLATQLKNRGVEPQGAPFLNLSFDKKSGVSWAKRFAASGPISSLVDYCKTTDRALVPFMQAYEDAHAGLQQYLKSRVEA